MNGYELSRKFVDYSFENPSKIKPNHYALYFFAIEHCNRLGWKKEFGLPTTMTMEAIGIKSYNTYIKTFNELINFGFFNLIERSKNQYSSNIIELSKFNKALDKALDKAFIKHGTKQRESTEQSIDSINKPINNKPSSITVAKDFNFYTRQYKSYAETLYKDTLWIEAISRNHIKHSNNEVNKKTIHKYLLLFLSHLNETQKVHENKKEFQLHFSNWLRKQNIEVVKIKQKPLRYS